MEFMGQRIYETPQAYKHFLIVSTSCTTPFRNHKQKASRETVHTSEFMMKRHKIITIFIVSLLFTAAACATATKTVAQLTASADDTVAKPALSEIESETIRNLLKSAHSQTETVTGYTQKYFGIPYPNGDVPANTGACTDVVIRSFRAADVDLQKEVHEDMKANFARYPQNWGLRRPDTNIDHRRVPNLHKFFERKGKSLEITDDAANYDPGDVVAWDLNGKGVTHIGVVSNIYDKTTKRYLVIHNIGGGTELEDVLFDWEVIGHYRYF